MEDLKALTECAECTRDYIDRIRMALAAACKERDEARKELHEAKSELAKYREAEQAGRLLVLPCGTDVELVRDGHAFKADHWNHTLTAFRDAPENKSGKQVALFSIKEAEAALAQKCGEG